jgi:2-iminobutanoate/2-iminopropanoate deaminase
MTTKQTYGTYSPYQQTNGFVYTSGQIGAVAGKATKDIKGQVKQALDNLKHVLESAGTDMSHVVKTTVFLTNMSHYADMNEVYAKMFSEAGSSPARTTVAVAELPRVADTTLLVEIEAVALLPKEL